MGRRRIFLLLLSAALALSLAGCGQAEPPSASTKRWAKVSLPLALPKR